MDVNGIAAVVAGGASGHGRAMATMLGEAAAKVALFDRNLELAEKTAAELGVLAVECDVSSADGADSAEAAFATARDLSSWGIRVNTIAPGITLTPLIGGLADETLDLLGKQLPFPKRTGHAGEYASVATELVRNEYINGETVRCDGAIRMAPR